MAQRLVHGPLERELRVRSLAEHTTRLQCLARLQPKGLFKGLFSFSGRDRQAATTSHCHTEHATSRFWHRVVFLNLPRDYSQINLQLVFTLIDGASTEAAPFTLKQPKAPFTLAIFDAISRTIPYPAWMLFREPSHGLGRKYDILVEDTLLSYLC